ncbi:hypothetical protein AB434_2318 [Heyndrickxia coagulans]|uniref:Uncharacterized protein n=1 Tax=Heyndrickxia coagulans TaxID=1398 RepID=A0AAN0WCT6_HEYCO|nr:hypothetical protein SB48_HM08orf04777 [Heyndrickxia coagulans]AKN54723.1 hypothetical protein AB434_2318 [Heyndrickxia coagulans]
MEKGNPVAADEIFPEGWNEKWAQRPFVRFGSSGSIFTAGKAYA